MISTSVLSRRTRRGLRLAAAVVVVAAFAGACSKSDSPAIDTSGATTTTAGAAAAASDQIVIKDFEFSPVSLTVKVGTAVTWTNTGSTDHTVTADDGTFDAGHIAPGKKFPHTFATAGTFKFHCAIHSSMVGSVTVQ